MISFKRHIKPLQELKDVVHNVPEIVEVVSRMGVDKLLAIGEQDGEDKAKEVLQLIFTQLMSARKEVIEQVLLRLISRLTAKREVSVHLLFWIVDKVDLLECF